MGLHQSGLTPSCCYTQEERRKDRTNDVGSCVGEAARLKTISDSLSSIPYCMLAEDYRIKEQRMIKHAGPFASVWNNHRDFVGDFVRGDQGTHPYTKKLDRAADIKNEAESISIITFNEIL